MLGNKGNGVDLGPADDGPVVSSGMGGIVGDAVDAVDAGQVGQRVRTMVEVVVPMYREVELPLTRVDVTGYNN